jgi:hypothetical protein
MKWGKVFKVATVLILVPIFLAGVVYVSTDIPELAKARRELQPGLKPLGFYDSIDEWAKAQGVKPEQNAANFLPEPPKETGRGKATARAAVSGDDSLHKVVALLPAFESALQKPDFLLIEDTEESNRFWTWKLLLDQVARKAISTSNLSTLKQVAKIELRLFALERIRFSANGKAIQDIQKMILANHSNKPEWLALAQSLHESPIPPYNLLRVNQHDHAYMMDRVTFTLSNSVLKKIPRFEEAMRGFVTMRSDAIRRTLPANGTKLSLTELMELNIAIQEAFAKVNRNPNGIRNFAYSNLNSVTWSPSNWHLDMFEKEQLELDKAYEYLKATKDDPAQRAKHFEVLYPQYRTLVR